MNKLSKALFLGLALSLALTACTGGNNNDSANNNGTQQEQVTVTASTKEMVDSMLTKVEQPMMGEMPEDMVQDMYHLDPGLLEEYTIMTPMMNVKSNEVAILKVKDVADIATVEEAVKQRAADVQQSFQQYLPDQYENAQNYKLVTKGPYVLFVISESADSLVAEFDAFFKA